MIDYQTENSFFAQGNFHFGEDAIPVKLTGSFKSNSSDAVTVYIWYENEDAQQLFESAMRYPYLVWFDGRTDTGESVWMMGIRPNQIEGLRHLHASVQIFIKGDLDTLIKPGEEIKVQAKVSNTPVVIPEWKYRQFSDGTIINVLNHKERSGITWESEHGEARLIDNYEYKNFAKDNHDLSLRIRVNSLVLSMIPDVETELKAILFQFSDYISEDLNLLSFIGRRRIVCTEASIRYKYEGKTSVAFARYKTWGGFYNLPSDQSSLRLLIKPQSLKDGVFKDLIDNYRQSKYKEVIDRTIPYLLVTYEDGYMETHLVNAYAALESLVDGIGTIYDQEYLLGNNQFKRLSKKVRALIREQIEDNNIAEGIIKKIPELRRRSFLDRLLFLLQEQGVNTKMIWPPGTDEPKEFHELLKRRNTLIHTGAVGRGDEGLFDLNRVQKLVELWILKLLECPYDAINEHSLYRNAPLNKAIH